MKQNDTMDNDPIQFYGCFSCGTVGGEFSEKIGGLMQCGACGEMTVISFDHALEVFAELQEYEVLDEYHELIGQFGVLEFNDNDED